MYVKVLAIPGSKKEKVTKQSDTVFEIMVREPAERNMANARIRELVAAAFGVSRGCVRLVSGHRSPRKIFDVQLLT